MPKITVAVTVLLGGYLSMQAQMLESPISTESAYSHLSASPNPGADVVTLGARISSELDDNILSTVQNRRSDWLTTFEPHLGWNLAGTRAKWTLDYRSSFSTSHPLAVSGAAQLFDTAVQLSITKRLSLRMKETFANTNNVFDPLTFSAAQASALAGQIAPQLASTRSQNQLAVAELNYSVGRRARLGVGTTFHDVSYSLPHSRANAVAAGFDGFYSYRLTRQNVIGFDLQARNLSSREPRSHAIVSTILVTDTVKLSAATTVSLFFGPEHSAGSLVAPSASASIANAAAPLSNWSWAGGVNLGGTMGNTRVVAGWFRRVSEEPAFEGIVSLSTTSAEVRRQLTPKWQLSLVASQDHSTPLMLPARGLDYLSFACGVTHSISARLSFDFWYWRLESATGNAIIDPYAANHNRFSTSLSYDLSTRPRKSSWMP